ncbi:MAG: magnesium/cobalt transporter CorA [Candidatus Omnitrophota bacterium]
MLKHYQKHRDKVGREPGCALHVGGHETVECKIRMLDYDSAGLREKENPRLEECEQGKNQTTVCWIDAVGIDQVETIGELGRRFGWHPLVVEDIVNAEQRPKMEEYDGYLYITLKALLFAEESHEIRREQISLIIGPSYVVTIREKEDPIWEPLLYRIRHDKGRIRRMGADYLAYAILDLIVDNYFLVLERIDKRMESVEKELIVHPAAATVRKIHHLKKELLILRKLVWPLREMIGRLYKEEDALFHKEVSPFLRDLEDHVIQIIDMIEIYRDSTSSMLDLYLSQTSYRLNEIMKVLTMFASIFIPLTFLAGVYGMNFTFMPELHWRFGYPLILGVMISSAIGMFLYFRRKKWI